MIQMSQEGGGKVKSSHLPLKHPKRYASYAGTLSDVSTG